MAPVATTATSGNPIIKPKPKFHPLDPLEPSEITAISFAIRKHTAIETDEKAVKFINTSLVAPPKREVLAYLSIPLETGKEPEAPPAALKRRAESQYINPITGDAFSALLTVVDGEWKVDEVEKLPVGVQPQITLEELCLSEEVLRSDPKVIELAAEVGIKPEELYADGWSIGLDDRFPDRIRLQQCLLYARFGKDENLYSHPMDFFPVIDSNTMKVIHIDFASHRLNKTNPSSKPHALDAGLQRPRIPPPMTRHEYLPDLLEGKQDYQGLRKDVKPLFVSQPEGVSFTVNGRELEWQKWKMHIGFNGREGLTLNTITYTDNGVVRPIAYKVSVAEMVVPYGDPQHPHPRKFAFDVGEYGMGTLANELSLGCDCLGTILYLPGCFVAHNGTPIIVKNAICIHEEDDGLLWKHTDYRPGGRAHSVRSRKLVISMIATVANYEYIFYWNFLQDGSFNLEIRLSGMLNVYVLGEGESAAPFGTQVAPRINAQYHQHLFSLRVDPMIDGINNSVTETDVLPYDAPTGSDENFAGNGFITQTSVIKTAAEGERKYSATTDRRWTIINPNKFHYSSGQPVGYRVATCAFPVLLAKPDSWVAKRAPFARSSLWVTQYEEGRDWPAGKYVPQAKFAPKESSLEGWKDKDGSVENTDIICWFTVGTNHIPRPEDWPVMPYDHLNIEFRPLGFFKQNPALDVPSTNDVSSKHAFGTGAVEPNGPNGTNGAANGHCANCA